MFEEEYFADYLDDIKMIWTFLNLIVTCDCLIIIQYHIIIFTLGF